MYNFVRIIICRLLKLFIDFIAFVRFNLYMSGYLQLFSFPTFLQAVTDILLEFYAQALTILYRFYVSKYYFPAFFLFVISDQYCCFMAIISSLTVNQTTIFAISAEFLVSLSKRVDFFLSRAGSLSINNMKY